MRSVAIALGTLFTLPLLFAAPARPPAELIANGSFEEGLESIGEYRSLDKGSSAITGWKVTRGQIDLVGSYWTAADGKRSIDLHGSPGNGGVSQTIKTKKGSRYQIEFQLAATPGAGERGIWVEAAGEKKQFDVDSGDGTKEKLKWKKVTWQFVATGTETVVEIHTTEQGDTSQGPVIDNVSVREK